MIWILWLSTAIASPVKIAVIDTGFNLSQVPTAKLCPGSEIANVSGDGTLEDVNGHGTMVLELIESKVNVDHCYILVKWYNKARSGKDGMADMLKALLLVKEQRPDVLNLSLGGYHKAVEEEKIIKDLLDSGTIVVAAAGNDNVDLDKDCSFYPACSDKRIVVVGASDNKKFNDGKVVDIYDKSVSRIWLKQFEQYGVTKGTSISAALVTGKIANQIKEIKQMIGVTP